MQQQQTMQIGLENVETVVKQLRLRPRQTLEEIAEATRLTKEKIPFCLILLTSHDQGLIIDTTYSFSTSDRLRSRNGVPVRRAG